MSTRRKKIVILSRSVNNFIVSVYWLHWNIGKEERYGTHKKTIKMWACLIITTCYIGYLHVNMVYDDLYHKWKTIECSTSLRKMDKWKESNIITLKHSVEKEGNDINLQKYNEYQSNLDALTHESAESKLTNSFIDLKDL